MEFNPHYPCTNNHVKYYPYSCYYPSEHKKSCYVLQLVHLLPHQTVQTQLIVLSSAYKPCTPMQPTRSKPEKSFQVTQYWPQSVHYPSKHACQGLPIILLRPKTTHHKVYCSLSLCSYATHTIQPYVIRLSTAPSPLLLHQPTDIDGHHIQNP